MRTGLQNGIPNSPGHALGEVSLFRFLLLLRVALFPLFPALASPGCRFSLLSRVPGSVWPVKLSLSRFVVGFGNACCFRLWRVTKRNGAFAGRFCVFLRVAGFSVITALAGYLYFGNHCSCGERGVVNHRPRVYPMHHSVLPEEGGVESRVRSSSSRRAVAREDRVAKRNPELARARTGGRCPFFVEVVGFGRATLPLFPALASPSFRLAGQGIALTLCCGFRKCVLFPLAEGGQTEWCICWSCRFVWLLRSRSSRQG